MTLSVFALNTPVSVTLTDLTRAEGAQPDLPPLAEWLGLEALDTDRVELFPIKDLGDLSLSQYLDMAHVAETGTDTARLDALAGSVLLVPASAMTGTPAPGAEATLVATLKTAKPDHSARLDKADIPAETEAPASPEPANRSGALPWVVGLGLALAALILWGLT